MRAPTRLPLSTTGLASVALSCIKRPWMSQRSHTCTMMGTNGESYAPTANPDHLGGFLQNRDRSSGRAPASPSHQCGGRDLNTGLRGEHISSQQARSVQATDRPSSIGNSLWSSRAPLRSRSSTKPPPAEATQRNPTRRQRTTSKRTLGRPPTRRTARSSVASRWNRKLANSKQRKRTLTSPTLG